MSIKNFLTILVFLCGFSVFVYPQNAEADAARRRQEAENLRRQQERDLNQRRIALDNLQRNSSRTNRAEFKREPLNKSFVLSKKEREARDKLTAPDAEDLALVQDFLKQPHTGIFRLFPDNNCLSNGVIYVDGRCKNIFPGTWLYSFRKKDYSDDVVFDLWLKDGALITDGFLSQGILVKLGNFSLDNVSLESKGAKFLVNFKPAEKAAEIKKQYDQIGAGTASDGYIYSRSAEAKIGEIYLMRVIAYGVPKKVLDKVLNNAEYKTKLKFQTVDRDERKDIITAFRIIRKEADGNLTIVWKRLDERKSPEIIFPDN